MYIGARMGFSLCRQRSAIPARSSGSLLENSREIRHPRSYDSIKITAPLMPFVYSLSLLAQNHYMLKPAKHPISLSANHTNHI